MDRSRKLLSPRQLLDSCIYRGLKLDTSRSIEVMGIQISRSDFWARLMYLCRVSFLKNLNLYKAYFRGRHMKEYKQNICKRWLMLYSLWKKLLRLCVLGFCNQVLLDLRCWWSEELCSQQSSSSWWVSHVLGSVQQKGWRSYIEELRGSEALEDFCCKFIYGDCRV